MSVATPAVTFAPVSVLPSPCRSPPACCLYVLWVVPPSYFMPPEQGGERITGMLDEAYVRPDSAADQFRVAALKRGDVAIEAIGADRERTRKLAELMAARLPPP